MPGLAEQKRQRADAIRSLLYAFGKRGSAYRPLFLLYLEQLEDKTPVQVLEAALWARRCPRLPSPDAMRRWMDRRAAERAAQVSNGQALALVRGMGQEPNRRVRCVVCGSCFDAPAMVVQWWSKTGAAPSCCRQPEAAL